MNALAEFWFQLFVTTNGRILAGAGLCLIVGWVAGAWDRRARRRARSGRHKAT